MTVMEMSSGLTGTQIHTTIAEPWTNTHINVIQLSYVWTIVNFDFLPEDHGQSVFSPVFSGGESDLNKWQVELFPRGDYYADNYLSVYLHAKSVQTPFVAKYKFSLLNAKNEKISDDDVKSFVFSSAKPRTGYVKFLKNEFIHDPKNELLVNDNLRLLCEINATSEIVVTSGPKEIVSFDETKRHLSNDLELLLESQKFSDVTIVAGEHQFLAHKSVLAARSPIFSGWFEEKPNQARFDVLPKPQNVSTEMLRFIYTDHVENLANFAQDLLLLADAYALEKLKIMCEVSLSKSLTINNAVDVLIAADAGNAVKLKAKVLDFIKAHVRAVIDTPGFTSLSTSHPVLATQVLRGLLA